MPRAISRCARSSASVVFPAPPTVALPQQITGTGARQPVRATRCAVIAAPMPDNGASACASQPLRVQNAGAWIIAANTVTAEEIQSHNAGLTGIPGHQLLHHFSSSDRGGFDARKY